MLFASEYRKIAREVLQGKWIRTVLIILLAGLLGASTGVLTPGSIDLSALQDIPATVENTRSLLANPEQIIGIPEAYADLQLTPEQENALMESFVPLFQTMAITFGVILLIFLFVGSIARIGLFAMGDRMLSGEKPRAGMLFPKGIYWKSVRLNLLRSLLVFLWSLLFVIPGWIAAYRYSMADYLLYTNPHMNAREAIQASKERMYGRKAALFMLEISFIGWSLLCGVPVYLAAFMGLGLGPTLFCVLLSSIASMFLTAYMHIAMCAFFRHMDHPWNRYQQEQRQEQSFSWDTYRQEAEAPEAEAETETDPAAPRTVPQPYVDTEPLARALFHRYDCSRSRILEAGEMETYAGYRIDSSVENRWIREYGQALMLRFSNDPSALDQLLPLIGEYALDELLDRTLARIERHILQRTLPEDELMNMLGRTLALVCSGCFSERSAYEKRKKEQISTLAAGLARRLEEQGADGDWRQALLLIQQMCAD